MKLDNYLIRYKITTEAFALKLSVSKSAVSKWRQGVRLPRKGHIDLIRKVTRNKVSYGDWFR